MPDIKQIKTFGNAQELMRKNMLVKHYAGSHAYGTALPTSDVDFRGIFCAEPVNVRTPFFKVEEVSDTDEEDTKFYELAHFAKLCVDCNPNIIETLWVDKKDITFSTPAYELLRTNRYSMLSSKIAFTTSGYALAQLKRIKGHNKWINNPQPKEPPQPKDFITMVQYFGEDKMLKLDLPMWRNCSRLVHYGNEIYGVYTSPHHQLYDDKGNLNVTRQLEGKIDDEVVAREILSNPIMIVKWNKDEYKLAKEKHKQYWTWKRNRNKTRGNLEEKFGYDTKHAMHLVRLLRMGAEALTEGKIIVKRPDAEELLAIRNGAWTYEEVVKYAEDMDTKVREELYHKTCLPKTVSLKRVAELVMEVQDLVWDNA